MRVSPRRAALLLLLPLLALASPAMTAPNMAAPAAADAPKSGLTDELVGWASCAAVLGIYESLLEMTPGSDADRDLLERAHRAEPRMEAYFNRTTEALDQADTKALTDRVTGQIEPRLLRYTGKPDAASLLLAEFRPDLEACVARAQDLPEAPVAPASPT